MEKENILFAEEKITEKEKEENIKGEKHIFCEGEGKYIFLWRRRRMEKEKEENIWRGKI